MTEPCEGCEQTFESKWADPRVCGNCESPFLTFVGKNGDSGNWTEAIYWCGRCNHRTVVEAPGRKGVWS